MTLWAVGASFVKQPASSRLKNGIDLAIGSDLPCLTPGQMNDLVITTLWQPGPAMAD